MKKSELPFGWTVLEAGGERFREIHDQRQGKPLGGCGPGERREWKQWMELEKAGWRVKSTCLADQLDVAGEGQHRLEWLPGTWLVRPGGRWWILGIKQSGGLQSESMSSVWDIGGTPGCNAWQEAGSGLEVIWEVWTQSLLFALFLREHVLDYK